MLALAAIAVAHSQPIQVATPGNTLASVTVAAAPETVVFGPLINAPNGHISYQSIAGGFDVWIAGRLPDGGRGQEGGFLLLVPDWSASSLAAALPTFCLGPTSPGVGDAFDRDYAALNSVVSGHRPGVVLGFYDAEFHPLSTPSIRVGQPLHSSIGLATSTDGGVTWVKQGQVIQGLDWAMLGKSSVDAALISLASDPATEVDDGANAPSAVMREDGESQYVYVYYADRTNFAIPGLPYSIYLARAQLGAKGLPGTWQKWTGSGWGAPGAQFPLAAVVSPPAGAPLAEHPSVSFNTELNSWVMFFTTHAGFFLATSADGIHWNPAAMVAAFSVIDPSDRTTSFPTYISAGVDQSMHAGSDARSSHERFPTQQVTGTRGWLYYSGHPDGSQYIGHRLQVTLHRAETSKDNDPD